MDSDGFETVCPTICPTGGGGTKNPATSIRCRARRSGGGDLPTGASHHLWLSWIMEDCSSFDYLIEKPLGRGVEMMKEGSMVARERIFSAGLISGHPLKNVEGGGTPTSERG